MTLIRAEFVISWCSWLVAVIRFGRGCSVRILLCSVSLCLVKVLSATVVVRLVRVSMCLT